MLVVRRIAASWCLWKTIDMSLIVYFHSVLSICNLRSMFALENQIRCSLHYLNENVLGKKTQWSVEYWTLYTQETSDAAFVWICMYVVWTMRHLSDTNHKPSPVKKQKFPQFHYNPIICYRIQQLNSRFWLVSSDFFFITAGITLNPAVIQITGLY